MEKILPLSFNSKIIHFNNYAVSFGILKANGINYDNIIIKYFLLPKWLPHKKRLSFGAPYSHLWTHFESSMIWTHIGDKNFINKIIEAINNGYYIYLTVNEYYIPDRNNYFFSNCVHDIYIYGYDMNKNAFLCAGFNEKQSFSTQYIKFNRIKKAFFRKVQNFCFIVFKLKNEIAEIDINTDFIISQLSKLRKMCKRKYTYFEYIKKELSDLESNDKIIDIKLTRFLYEHTYCLNVLGKYYDTDCFLECSKLGKNILLKSIYYKQSPHISIIKELILIINDLKILQTRAIDKFIDIIKVNSNTGFRS